MERERIIECLESLRMLSPLHGKGWEEAIDAALRMPALAASTPEAAGTNYVPKGILETAASIADRTNPRNSWLAEDVIEMAKFVVSLGPEAAGRGDGLLQEAVGALRELVDGIEDAGGHDENGDVFDIRRACAVIERYDALAPSGEQSQPAAHSREMVLGECKQCGSTWTTKEPVTGCPICPPGEPSAIDEGEYPGWSPAYPDGPPAAVNETETVAPGPQEGREP